MAAARYGAPKFPRADKTDAPTPTSNELPANLKGALRFPKSDPQPLVTYKPPGTEGSPYRGAVMFKSSWNSIKDGSDEAPEIEEDPHQPDPELYDICRSVILKVIEEKANQKLITALEGDKAQSMVDILSKILEHRESLSPKQRKNILHLLANIAKSAQVFPKSLEIKNVQCDLTKYVAAGGFGFIYKGEYNRSIICVKAVQNMEGPGDKNRMKAQAGELILWAHMSHSNVIPFSGIYLSVEPVPRVCIVSPWMEHGDLIKYLGDHPDADPIPLVYDIISGLKYMHDLDIVHADLKGRNVLVSEGHRAMLADFGVSRVEITAVTMKSTAAAGTAYWMAPELLKGEEEFPKSTFATDIWAFACTCFEIITGKTPFHPKPVPNLIGSFMMGRVIPPKPENAATWNENKKKVWSVAERCWKLAADERPTAAELVVEVHGLNTKDNRPSESEYPRTKTKKKLDYDRVFDVLKHNFQDAVAEAKAKQDTQKPRVMPAENVKVVIDKEATKAPAQPQKPLEDRAATAMIEIDTMGGTISGPFSKFTLEVAFKNPETQVEDILAFNVNSDVTFSVFNSVGALDDPPTRKLEVIFQSKDQFTGFDKFSGRFGQGRIYIRTRRGVVIKGNIEGGPRSGQTFAGSGTWTRA